MNYFFGKAEKEEVKVDSEITDKFRSALKKQFCQICQKNPSTKVAFGRQLKPVFTCPNCQLQAVGGQIQKLGPKTLISNEKYIELLTKELINYQTCRKNTPAEQKKSADNCQQLKQKSVQLCDKIRQQYKKMKSNIKQKHEELVQQSNKQNTVLIFEEVGKVAKEKKYGQLDQGRMIVKRSLVNSKGLHFSDQEGIEAANQSINEKFSNLKKQSKVKLKPMEDLIDEINKIEF